MDIVETAIHYDRTLPTGRLPLRRRLRFVVWLLAGAGMAIFVRAADRIPANPAEPLTLSGPQHVQNDRASTLRVATFNLHGFKGRDGKRDIDRAVESLRGFDFVTLQEAHGCPLDCSDDQVTQLGGRLQMASLFVPTEERWWAGSFGNGVLTRNRLVDLHRIPLECTQGRKYRNAILAHMKLYNETVHVLTVHIDNCNDHDAQLEEICHLFLSLAEPAVLVGDLNTRIDNGGLQQLFAHHSVTDVIGEQQEGGLPPIKGVDWIVCRGLRAIDSRTRDLGASDHPVVFAELELLRPAPRSRQTTSRDDANKASRQ